LQPTLATCLPESASYGGIFDFDQKVRRLEEVSREIEDPELWNDPKRAQDVSIEKKRLEDTVLTITGLEKGLNDALELFELSKEEDDEDTLLSIEEEVTEMARKVEKLEFKRMFNQPHDQNQCFLEIQAGAGGTEAQDWASMLERMYLKFADRQGFNPEVVEETEGDVAGIKGCTIKMSAEYAYGWLRTETGIHRLVRKSPFDANAKRHTSFASVFVYPEVDNSIQIDINPADLRIDTFRASGAGGQHIQKTDSAVRITHLPTGTVAVAQTGRSQHQNKEEAMGILKAKLYERELRERMAAQQALEDSKSDISWGHQIRSYVLDQSRVKDLRTNVETGNTAAVLDGFIDNFIEASLKQGV
jgi:peptide chain release factor 2